MIPTKYEVTCYIRNRIDELVTYARDEFNLDVSDIKVGISFKDRNCYGVGGMVKNQPIIDFFVGRLVNYQVQSYCEYARLTCIKGVHGFYTDDWREWLEALILHEFAHVLQYGFVNRPSNRRSENSSYIKGFGMFAPHHSRFFVAIYKHLRDKFLNDAIKHRQMLYHNRVENFVGFWQDQAEKRKNRLRPCPEYAGKSFRYHGQVYTIKGIDPKKRKYNIVAFTESGKCVCTNAHWLTHYAEMIN